MSASCAIFFGEFMGRVTLNTPVSFKGSEPPDPKVLFGLSNRSRGCNLLIYYGLKQPKFRNFADFASAL